MRDTGTKGGVLNSRALHVLIILIVALAAYSNSFNVPFQFDDTPNIVDNPLIKDFRFFADPSLAEDVPMKHVLRFKSRAVGYLTFAMNYRMSGLDVRGYHAVNLAVHIATALVLYWLVLLSFSTPRLEGSKVSERAVALLASLVFVAHPVQTQAVTFIVQRLASLATLFYVLSFTLYVRCRLAKRGKAALFILSLISAALAMKTKEIAITLPAALAIYELMFMEGSKGKRLASLAPFALVALIIPLGMIGSGTSAGDIMGGVGEATRLVKDEMSRSSYLFTEFRVMATYLRLLVLPVNQSLDHGYAVYGSLSEPPVFLSLILLVAVLGLGIFTLRGSRKTEPALALVALGVFWFFTTISVESSVIPIADAIFEHRLYLPSVGFAIAAATAAVLAVDKFNNSMARAAAIFAVAVIVLSLSAATYARNEVWQSRLALWSDAAAKAPENSRAHNNLGSAYLARQDFENAIEHYEKAAALEPDSAPIQNNLASAYASNSMYGRAIEHFSRAVELDPGYVQARNHLASTLFAMGRAGDAIEQYNIILKQRPDYTDAYINMGIVYNAGGSPETGAEYLRRAIKMRPDILAARYNLGNSYLQMGRYDEAIAQYQKALKLGPDHVQAAFNLGNAYMAKGDSRKAIKSFERAVELSPGLIGAHVNLGFLYGLEGDTVRATEHYEDAVAYSPSTPEPYFNLANAYMRQGRAREASSLYERAVALAPDNPGYHKNLAIAYREMGLGDKADEQFRIAERLMRGKK